jgi:hypothetical protein
MLQRVRPRGVAGVELQYLRRGRALLRPVDRRRSVLPEERVRDVAGHLDRRWVEQPSEPIEALEHPAPTVSRGTPADPDRDLPGGGIDRGLDEITGPEARGADRVSLVGS